MLHFHLLNIMRLNILQRIFQFFCDNTVIHNYIHIQKFRKNEDGKEVAQ